MEEEIEEVEYSFSHRAVEVHEVENEFDSLYINCYQYYDEMEGEVYYHYRTYYKSLGTPEVLLGEGSYQFCHKMYMKRLCRRGVAVNLSKGRYSTQFTL